MYGVTNLEQNSKNLKPLMLKKPVISRYQRQLHHSNKKYQNAQETCRFQLQ